ncbi:zinc-ribbon domain-containing protein [Pseudomonas stutzeri]|nr:zinc-ribbon domain-containing protein [Stutzerimonas stutzeri]
MTSFVTQCPHCRTRFRIGRSQLRAARGAARCGACMEVFNAAHHLLRDDIDPTRPLTPPPLAAELAEPEPGAIAAAASPSPRSSDETLWIHDDLDLDSLDLDAELAKLERQERELSADLNALRHDSPGTSLPHEAPADEAAPQDESWAELLLNAEQSVSARRTDEPDDPISFTPVSAETPRQPAPLAPSTSALSTARAQQARNERVEPELAPPEQPMQAAEAIAPPRREPDLRDEPLFELDDEPLQLDWQERKNPWPRRLGWGALNLLALLALGAQYVAYNYDELSRQAAYRPWFERVCPTLGCELPALVDISQIKSSNLVVRSHPDFTGALVVDAILYNRAAFAQPFPLLEIRFADINGKLLASRSFKPSEYLSGELAGQAQMPPQVPIHIALDILDPGAQAVNYSLGFHSPD